MELLITIVVPLAVVAIPMVVAAIWTVATLKNESGNLCRELKTLSGAVTRLDRRMDGFNTRMDDMENRCLAHRGGK